MPLAEILRARDAEGGVEAATVHKHDGTVDLLREPNNPVKLGSPSAEPQRQSWFKDKSFPSTSARGANDTSALPPGAQGTPQGRSAPNPARPEAKGAPAPLKKVQEDTRAASRPTVQTEPAGVKQGDPDQRYQVIVFFSCKGGAGSTALAANVAHYFARDKYNTCLVDLDLQLGDALAALGLQPKQTIAQSITMAQKGEVLALGQLPQHASGVNVLSQVGALDDLDKVNPEGMATMVEGLRKSYDAIVIDGVRDFSDNVLAVLDVADRIAIVTVQEVLAVRRARWTFSILRKIGFDPSDITVVVNRFDPESEIPFVTLKRIFEPGKVMAVPTEQKLVLQSLNRGVPLLELNPTHTLTRNIGRLAAHLVGNQEASNTSEATVLRKQSFWQRMRTWGKT